MEGTYRLGEFNLQSSEALPDASLAYETYGTLNETGDNVIVYPTWAAGRHTDNRSMALDSHSSRPTTM